MHKVALAPSVVARAEQRRGGVAVFHSIDPAKTAHIVVDLQNGFMAPGQLSAVATAPGIVPAVNRISAALRAAEMGCDALLKGTSVDGVNTADPKKDPTATRYETLTYQDVLAKDLRVMDASAIAMMRDTGIPIVVFSIREDNSLRRTLTGDGTFTVIQDVA